MRQRVCETIAARPFGAGRGKSGLHRTRSWVTPRRGDPTEQCHRNQTADGLPGLPGKHR